MEHLARLSILIPLYNEEEFITALLERVLAAELPPGMEREIIIVDDCSKDRSYELAERMQRQFPRQIRLFRHQRNQGKGAAVRTAISHATGDYTIIQDADLEYDPCEYSRLLHPLITGRGDVAYGSRFLPASERRVLYYWHALGNKLLTTLCNIVSDLNLTDMETCYKVFRTSLLKSIPIRNDRFGIEPEITIKLAQREARIFEVPISYYGRTYAEGKKIGLKDAFETLFVILRFAIFKDCYQDSGGKILAAMEEAGEFNRWMADVIRPDVGDRVLEIGAGIGNLTRHLIPHRELYVASDVEPEYLTRLRSSFLHRPQARVRQCDLTDSASFETLQESVDSVICLNVLEHVEAEATALDNIHSALRPGGKAIVLVPEGMDAYGTLDEALGHCRRYSKDSLKAAMERAGFRVERIIEFNRAARPGWVWNGKVLKRRSISRLQLRIYNKLVWLWRRLDRFLPWKPTSLIAIGVKGAAAGGPDSIPGTSAVHAAGAGRTA